MAFDGDRVRVLVIPGLHGSGPGHWQRWLQARCKGARRVDQHDPAVPDLRAWSARIAEVLAAETPTRWVAVAHSFGCLALAHALAEPQGARQLVGALFVAPAEPERFGVATQLPAGRLPVPSAMIASDTDPWMSAASASRWATAWGSRFVNLGDVGHLNTEAGFGPLPRALSLTESLIRRAEQARRLGRAHARELSFAI